MNYKYYRESYGLKKFLEEQNIYIESLTDEQMLPFILLFIDTKEKKRLLRATLSPEDLLLFNKLHTYKTRAQEKGLEYNLTFEYFKEILSEPCVYCGANSHNTIDRKDSTMGYVIDNVQPTCSNCNSMKSFTPHEVFQEQIEKIVKYQIEKKHTP